MDYAEQLDRIIETFNAGNDSKKVSDYNPTGLKSLENANVFFTTSVLGMQAISNVIEDQAMTLSASFRFYSAFQRFSRAKNQRERYNKLLATNNPVFVFGIPDDPLWQDPNLIAVALDEPVELGRPHLAHNWFVVLHNPQFVSMALVSRELPNLLRPSGAPDKLVYRSFEGFWTYDINVINQVVEVLDGYIRDHLGAKALRV